MPDGMAAKPPSPADAVINREQWIPGEQSKADPFLFVVSTDDVDRMGDIIEVDGWKLGPFKRNPIALFGHDHRSPIGTWEDVGVVEGKLVARLNLAAHGTSPFLNTIRSLIEQRILRATSVGFRPIKAEALEGSRVGGIRFIEQELLEISVVTVPANAAALQVARSFSLPDDEVPRLFASSGRSSVARFIRQGSPALPPKPTPSTATRNPTGAPKMKIAERLAALEAKLLESKDNLSTLSQKEDLDEADNALLVALPEQIEELKTSIESWKKAQAALGTAAAPAGGVDPTTSVARTTPPAPGTPTAAGSVPATVKRGRAADLLVHSALIALRCYTERRSVEEIIERDFGESRELLTVARAVTAPAQTGVTGWAAELMETVTGDFQDMLMPESIWRRMPMSRFSFDNGKIRLPGRNARGLAGSFVSEGQPIPVKQTVFSSVLLEPYKLAVITALTRELAKYSNPAAIPIMRQAMIDDTVVTLDSLFLDANAAVPTLRPAGLQALATGANTRATSGTTLANIITDLKAATTQMMGLNLGRRPVWVMNSVRYASLALQVNAAGSFMFRDELANGTLIGYPVLHSTNVPSSVVFLIDASELATAADITPEIEISTEATLHMESTPSTAVADGTGATDDTVAPIAFPPGGAPGGTPGTSAIGDFAQPVRSLFQTYSLALRLVWPVDWDLRRAGGVQTITGVAW